MRRGMEDEASSSSSEASTSGTWMLTWWPPRLRLLRCSMLLPIPSPAAVTCHSHSSFAARSRTDCWLIAGTSWHVKLPTRERGCSLCHIPQLTLPTHIAHTAQGAAGASACCTADCTALFRRPSGFWGVCFCGGWWAEGAPVRALYMHAQGNSELIF